MYSAVIGHQLLCRNDSLGILLEELAAVHEAQLGEDVVVWKDGKEVVAVMLAGGELRWMGEAFPRLALSSGRAGAGVLESPGVD